MKLAKLISCMLICAGLATGCEDSDDSTNPATGGTAATGGTTETGGMAATGGAAETGGMAATGGATETGGMAATGGTETPALVDIVDTAVAAGSFTKLAELVTQAGLVETLKGTGPFTVFAPTDAAFTKFETDNPGVLASLTNDELVAVLTYHVVAGAVKSTDLVDGLVAVTVNGSPILFDLESGVMVNDATVSTADVEASNGVIHVIDSIILPPSMDIVETAVDNGSFTTLAQALTDAGLVDTLKGDGPFTVFAPTDAAFTQFETDNPGVLAGLSTEELTNILLYHVVSGAVGSGSLVDGAMVDTLNTGAQLTVDLSSGVMINSSNVTTANIITKNGVIHVIDTVLVPSP